MSNAPLPGLPHAPNDEEYSRIYPNATGVLEVSIRIPADSLSVASSSVLRKQGSPLSHGVAVDLTRDMSEAFEGEDKVFTLSIDPADYGMGPALYFLFIVFTAGETTTHYCFRLQVRQEYPRDLPGVTSHEQQSYVPQAPQ